MKNVVIVTGCSSGIGFEITRECLKDQLKVIGISRNRPTITDANFIHLSKNLSEEVDLESDLTNIESVSAIICAAGILKGGRLSNLKTADLHEMWKIHVSSHIQLIKLLEPKLNNEARIILIGSRISNGAAEKSAYAATKAALIGFTRSIASELIDRQITVNIVSPAATKTPMLDDPHRAKIFPRVPPMGRFIDPNEIAGVVKFLMSPAAKSITGQNIEVCAGASL